MTIMAQPGQIGNFVIFTIFINVVDSQYSFITCFTEPTHLWDLVPSQDTTIRIKTVLPVRMLTPDINLVAPLCLTRFIAEEFSTLRSIKGFLLFIHFLPADKTTDHLSVSACSILTSGGTKYSMTFFKPGRFRIKIFRTLFTLNRDH